MKIRRLWRAALARRWLGSCASVGARPHLIRRPTISSSAGAQVHIGDRLRLSSQPVTSHLVAGPGALLQIGNDVSIGCGAAIASFEHIRIGDGTRIGPFVIVMDTNFHGSPGDQSVRHDCRPVKIGEGCRIGSRVTITRGATIGAGAEILAGSVVSSSIPPGVCAAGARARIIGRAGEVTTRWESTAAALPDLLMSSLDLPAPPNLDSCLIPKHLWTSAHVTYVLEAIEDQFGVALDPVAAREIKSFGDIAAAVDPRWRSPSSI